MARVQLSPEIERRLDDLAGHTGHIRTYHVRECIMNGLDDLEDFHLANATMEHVLDGHELILESFEVRSSLGLANNEAN